MINKYFFWAGLNSGVTGNISWMFHCSTLWTQLRTPFTLGSLALMSSSPFWVALPVAKYITSFMRAKKARRYHVWFTAMFFFEFSETTLGSSHVGDISHITGCFTVLARHLNTRDMTLSVWNKNTPIHFQIHPKTMALTPGENLWSKPVTLNVFVHCCPPKQPF